MWCYRYYRKCNQQHISVEVILVHTVLKHWPVAAPIRGCTFTPWTSTQKKKKKKKECASPRVPITPNDGERMAHMQIVPPFHCHVKRKTPSFITAVTSCTPPWAQTMNPGPSSLLLFVFNCQEKESKASYKAFRQHSCFLQAKRESLRHRRGNAARRPSLLWIEPRTDTFFTRTQNLYPFVFGSFCWESIPALKSKWASCALHVGRWEGA